MRDRRDGPVRVELTGLPAVGKTTAAQQAHAVLRQGGLEAGLDCVGQWRPHPAGWIGDYLRSAGHERPRVTVTGVAAWLVRHRGDVPAADLRRAWGAGAYLVAVDAHVRRLRPSAVWLHDQATVQALWSLALRSGTPVPEVVDAFAGRVAWPDLVVELRTTLPTLAGRLRRRWALPAALPPTAPDLEAALTMAAAAADDLRHSARAHAVRWVTLDGHDEVGADVAERVRAALSRRSLP